MAKKISGLMLLVMVSAIGVSWQLQAQQHKRTKLPSSIQTRDKLHERALKAGGHYVLRYLLKRDTIYPNLEELANRSDAVVIGRTLGSRSKLRDDGNFISQDFLVRVQEVVKGDLPAGRSITVSLPGGSHMFEDKTFVMVVPLGTQQVENQTTYLFFLKTDQSRSASPTHRLTSDTQGMFALASGKVQPASLSKSDPVVMKYSQMDVADFLREVHKAVPRKERKEAAARNGK